MWFHVDKESSAHVYLRLKPGETLDDIPSNVLDDCAQLVKANSIKGSKLSSVDVVYTWWSNLKKTPNMEVGQVGFHDPKQVRMTRVEKRINAITNRLEKTKVSKPATNLRAEREERDLKERTKQKELQREIKTKEKEEAKRKEEAAKLKSYDNVMSQASMRTNAVTIDAITNDNNSICLFSNNRMDTTRMISCETSVNTNCMN